LIDTSPSTDPESVLCSRIGTSFLLRHWHFKILVISFLPPFCFYSRVFVTFPRDADSHLWRCDAQCTGASPLCGSCSLSRACKGASPGFFYLGPDSCEGFSRRVGLPYPTPSPWVSPPPSEEFGPLKKTSFSTQLAI